MSTWCGSSTLHTSHTWGIEPDPGFAEPDLFWCEGVTVEQLRSGRKHEPVKLHLGKIDTSGWPLP